MIGPDKERRFLRMLEDWDPDQGDLPDELALALDESELLRARFDERFARWQPEEEPVPDRLEERVLPDAPRGQREPRRRWIPIVVAGLGGMGVLGLAASMLVVIGAGTMLTMSSAPMQTVYVGDEPGPAAASPAEAAQFIPGADANRGPRVTATESGAAQVRAQLESLGYLDAVHAPVATGASAPFNPDSIVPPERNLHASGDGFVDHGVNGWFETSRAPLSTFAIDVDRGSYSFARRRLREGFLPDPSAVRVEEFVNALSYDYPDPDDGPFTVQFEASPGPWGDARHIVRIGVQGKRPAARMPVHLTFLVDTSGSMSGEDRLPLVKKALSMLVEELDDGDTVAIVTYAGSAGVALPPTPATDKKTILRALERLEAGGSTAMGQGIGLAYALASETRREGHVNRVIIASDGDANVGITNPSELNQLIRRHADQGIALTTLGFGQGNYQDFRMEQLANEGDGNYYYIDGLEEARRVFVDELTGTLEVIARDVKIQVEWNPHAVRRYRLVGYENRMLANEDFRVDAVDAGEIGAGHTVTALYSVELVPGASDPIATVRLRAKPPGPDAPASERTFTLPRGALQPSFEDSSPDHRMAVAASAFAERLRGSPFVAGVGYTAIAEIARGAARSDHPQDAELLELITRAARLSGPDANPRCREFPIVSNGEKKTVRIDDLGHPCN